MTDGPCESCEKLRLKCKILSAENAELRRRLAASSSSTRLPVMPPCPFDSVAEFEEWESLLRGKSQKEQQRRDQLRVELNRGNCVDAAHYIKCIWKSLLSDEVAENYSYIGNGKNRMAIKGYVFTRIFEECFLKRYKDKGSFYNSLFFIKYTKRFFSYAMDNQRRKYLKLGKHDDDSPGGQIDPLS